MKKLLLFLYSWLSIVCVAAQNPLPIGANMPKGEVKMKDVGGTITSLNEAKTANGLLALFTCNTCPYVIKNQSRTKEIAQMAADNKLGVVLLNSNEANRMNDDSYSAMQAYAKTQHYQCHYLLDSNSEIANAFGAARTPECFLFDKTGKLVYRGAIDDSPADITHVKRQHLKEAITEMLGGKEVAVKETRSIGCGIKRKE